MKAKLQKFAKYALVLSGLGLLSTIVTAVIFGKFNLPVQISLAAAVIGLAAYALMDPAAVRQFLSGREAKYGSNSLVMILAVLGILVVVNLIGYKNTVRWDLTQDKSNSLAKETLDVLKALDQPVKAQAFFTAQTSVTTAETLLRNLKANSGGKFDYEFLDPNQNPVEANAAGVTRDGSIVLTSGGAKETVTTVNEEQLTSALIRLKSPEKKILYALTGHGEPSFTSSEATGFSYAASELQSKNYTINELNLLTTNSIPADARGIIIAAPQKPLSENEVNLIKAFVDKGGSLLVMYQPKVLTQFGDLPDPLASYLSQTWHITLQDNFVIDQTANPISTAVAASYGASPITKPLQNMVTIFPTARSLTVDTSGTPAPTVLVSTGGQSWAETDMQALQQSQATFDQAVDTAGPLALMASNENTTTKSRVVVAGDADFAANAAYAYYGNADLFLNAVDWMSGQDQLISLTAKTQTTRTLITPNQYVRNAILFGGVILIPAVILVTAIVVFVKRQREV